MEWYRIYQEVSNEIAFLGFRITDLEKEYEFWYRSIYQGHRKPIAPLDVCLKRMQKIKEDAEEYTYLLGIKENTLNQMDRQLEDLDIYEYEVIRLNVFEGMKLLEVAKKMSISEIWAKKLSSRARKKLVI